MMIKRRFSLVVGATAALVGGTYAFADAASAQASTRDMQAEVSTSGLPAIASPTIDTRSLFYSAKQIAQSLGLPLPPLGSLPVSLSNTDQLTSDPTGVVTGILNNPMGVLNVVDISSVLAPVSGLTGGVSSIVSNPTTAMATLTSDPISTINALLGTVASADPTGLVSGVIQGLGGNPVSIVTGVVSNPTGAVSSLLSNPAGAVSGVLNTVSQADPTGLVGSVVNTVTSQVSVPALPVLPVVGDVTSTVSNTLNSVTGTVNGLLGSVTSSLPLPVPSTSSINNVTGNLTSSLPVAANVCLQVVGCL
jgi:phage-related protein